MENWFLSKGHPGDQRQQQNVLNLDIVDYKYSYVL